MLKSELVKRLTEDTGLPARQVSAVLNALIAAAAVDMEESGSFELPGIGSFERQPPKEVVLDTIKIKVPPNLDLSLDQKPSKGSWGGPLSLQGRSKGRSRRKWEI
jgi:hypothetical protein